METDETNQKEKSLEDFPKEDHDKREPTDLVEVVVVINPPEDKEAA
jgi:hypothetical protein